MYETGPDPITLAPTLTLTQTFEEMVYETDEDYFRERAYFVEALTPLVLKCKELGRAMRIGTNHGSLSARVLSFYGDTPRGMVESAIEFADICRSLDYHNFVFSMKVTVQPPTGQFNAHKHGRRHRHRHRLRLRHRRRHMLRLRLRHRHRHRRRRRHMLRLRLRLRHRRRRRRRRRHRRSREREPLWLALSS